MFCTRCGIELADSVNYCSSCGAATPNARSSSGFQTGPAGAGFTRPVEGKKIAGVCAGVARYWGLDATLVRVVWAILALWPPGIGLLAYIVCWIVMPKDPAAVVGASAHNPSAS